MAALEALSIRPVHQLDGVGANYQDHAVTYVTYEGTGDLREDWVIPKLSTHLRERSGRWPRRLPHLPAAGARLPGLPPLLAFSVHLLEQRSRGGLTLASDDPAADPVIENGMLEDDRDVDAMVTAMRFVEQLARHRALKPFYGRRIQPADDDWAAFARSTYATYYHGVGTCRFGPAGDPMAVTDPTLRVRGIDNLWVADASALPVIPHANTNVSALLVGEVVARNLVAA